MDPVTTVTCGTACTVTHVITIDVPPFNLTESDGAQIAAAILAVWVVGWGFRTLIRHLRETDGTTTEEEK